MASKGPEAAQEHRCCHRGEPKKSPAPVKETLCCQAVKVVLPDGQAMVVVPPELPVLGEVVWPALVLAPQLVETAGTFATGPPRAFSFAETVLQQSLPALAPPVAV